MRRLSEFKRSLGLAPNVLAKRLEGFVASGLLGNSTDDGDHVDHYRPTEGGLAFKPVIVALSAWGDRWAAPRYVVQCRSECDFHHVLVRPPVGSLDPHLPDRR
jgi:DNA-binding HxlR family transcriptional regulator